MIKYALDADIISFYLKGNIKLIDRINNEVKDGTIVIPHNYTLITNNIKHYENIKDLKFDNWMHL